MKNIAFKRAKNCPAVASALHPEFICEYADTTLIPEGFHKPEDGYEILPEDEFLEEFSMNSEYQRQLEASKKKLDTAMKRAEAEANKRSERENLKLQKEFEEFQAWKALRDK